MLAPKVARSIIHLQAQFNTSSAFLAKVGKSPNISKSDSETNCGQNELDLVPPSAPIAFHDLHFFGIFHSFCRFLLYNSRAFFLWRGDGFIQDTIFHRCRSHNCKDLKPPVEVLTLLRGWTERKQTAAPCK